MNELPGLWRITRVKDIRVDDHICDYCGKKHIRYVHSMSHSGTGKAIKVGCVCAGYLSGNPVLASSMEREARNRTARLARWLTGWERTEYGYQKETRRGLRFKVLKWDGEKYSSSGKEWRVKVLTGLAYRSWREARDAGLDAFSNISWGDLIDNRRYLSPDQAISLTIAEMQAGRYKGWKYPRVRTLVPFKRLWEAHEVSFWIKEHL